MAHVVQRILSNSLRLTSIRAVVLALGALQNIILAKLLGPGGLGEASLYSMIFVYVGLTGFGLDTVAAREIPGRMAADDEKRYELLKDMAFTYETGLRLLICLIVLFVGVAFYSGSMQVGLVLVAAVLFVNKLESFYYTMGRATKQFKALGRGNLINAFFMFLLTVSLVKVTGAYTQMVAMFAVSVGTIYFYMRTLDLGLRLRFDRHAFLSLLKNGIPFVALGVAFHFWQISDKTMIATFLDLKMLGMYAFGASCAQLVFLMSSECLTVFEPFVYERIALARGRAELYKLVYTPSLLLGYLTPIVLALAWVTYPVFVHWLMPEYEGSIWPFRILVGQAYLVGLSVMVTYLLRSAEVNKQSGLTFSYLIAGCLSYLFMWVFLKAGWGLVGVALGFLLARFVALIHNCLLAQSYYLESWREATLYYKRLLFPMPLLFMFVGCLAWIEQSKVIADGWQIVISGIAFLAIAVILLWRLNRKVVGIVTTGIWDEMWGMLGRKLEAYRGGLLR